MNAVNSQAELSHLSPSFNAETTAPAAKVVRLPVTNAMVNPHKSLIARWISRHRTRQALRKLDQRMLDDIGLNSAEIHAELAKPFWKA